MICYVQQSSPDLNVYLCSEDECLFYDHIQGQPGTPGPKGAMGQSVSENISNQYFIITMLKCFHILVVDFECNKKPCRTLSLAVQVLHSLVF